MSSSPTSRQNRSSAKIVGEKIPLDTFISNLITSALESPDNLAGEAELREQVAAARQSFAAADTDRSGTLTVDELFKISEFMGLPANSEDNELLLAIDSDDSGEIEIEEWLTWWIKRVCQIPNPARQQEAIASNMFRRYDTDNSGEMDTRELEKLLIALGARFSKTEMNEVMRELDQDSSGLIDHTEFVDWWTQRSVKNREAGSLIALKLRKIARKAAKMFSTDIFSAVWNNDLELVKSFVASDSRSMLAQDISDYGNGFTCLHYACYQGFADVVAFLVDEAATKVPVRGVINKTNDDGFTPIFYAAQQGHYKICLTLLDLGADPTSFGSVNDGEQFMSVADFAVESSLLREALLKHERCGPPECLDPNQITCKISRNGNITCSINLGLSRGLPSLPVKSWCIRFCYQPQDNPQSIEILEPIKVKAMPPKSNHTYEFKIDQDKMMEALGKIVDTGSAAYTSNACIDLLISGVNALDLEGLPITCKLNCYDMVISYSKNATNEAAPKAPDSMNGRSSKKIPASSK